MNSHITFFSQTCYRLIFLRKEASKTYNRLERPWERVQLIVHMIPLQWLGVEVWGEDREEGNTNFGHQPFSLFSVRPVFYNFFAMHLELSRLWNTVRDCGHMSNERI